MPDQGKAWAEFKYDLEHDASEQISEVGRYLEVVRLDCSQHKQEIVRRCNRVIVFVRARRACARKSGIVS